MNQDKFREHLIWAEGYRNFPYQDSVGKTSIGVGRNLDDKGLSDDEIGILLENDINDAVRSASSMSYWDSLTPNRQLVVADMVFNMGLRRFKGFIKTNAALERGDWDEAAREMVDSRWFRQTGRRSRKLVAMMIFG